MERVTGLELGVAFIGRVLCHLNYAPVILFSAMRPRPVSPLETRPIDHGSEPDSAPFRTSSCSPECISGTPSSHVRGSGADATFFPSSYAV